MLLVPAAASATPLMPGEAGQFMVFADYDTWYTGAVLGVGYAVSDLFMAGGFYDIPFSALGVFADLNFGPILANGEVEFDGGSYWGKISACYAHEFDSLTLGAGLGMDFGTLGGTPFTRFAVDLAAEDNLHVFAAVDYYYDDDWMTFQGGLARVF